MRGSAWILLVFGCQEADPPPGIGAWGAPGDDLPAALLSVWSDPRGHVWAAGADPGDGPLVLEHTGQTWVRHATGSRGVLWWGWSGAGSTWLVGDGARVLRYDGTFTEHEVADPRYKLFGVWGRADDDLYAVGGDISGTAPGIVLHHDGSGWRQVATAPGALLFKVWGHGDDVLVVGSDGRILHDDGQGWTEAASPVAGAPLVTVHGHGGAAYAVGGVNNAIVARWTGEAWIGEGPPPEALAPPLSGVHAAAGSVVACGASGTIWRRAAAGWQLDDDAAVTDHDLHACWQDAAGAVWAVGGDLVRLDAGVLVTNAAAVARVP